MTESQVRADADPLDRLRDALDAERAVAAVGAAKDLVEAACRVSLQRAGQNATGAEKLPALFKLAAASLPGEAHELGRSVVGAVQRLAELRNASGAGHGHAKLADVPVADARLAGAVAVAVADFVLGRVGAPRPRCGRRMRPLMTPARRVLLSPCPLQAGS